MTGYRAWPAVALVAGIVLAVGGTSAQEPLPMQPKLFRYQPKVVPMPAAPAAELPLVPKSSAAFISLRVADIIDHAEMKQILEEFKKLPGAYDGLTEVLGVAPHELDRITLFWPSLGGHGPDAPILVVTTREAYNEARVLKALQAIPVFDGRRERHDPLGPGQPPRVGVKNARSDFGKAVEGPRQPPSSKSKAALPPEPGTAPPPEPKPLELEKKDSPNDDTDTVPIVAALPAEPLFYELERGGFDILFLIDERTLVFLPTRDTSDTAMLALVAQLLQKKPVGPLADAITDGGRHTFAAGVQLTPLFKEFVRGMPEELAPYVALTSARTAIVTGDLGKTAKFSLRLAFDDAAAARRAAPVLEEGIRTVAGRIVEASEEVKAKGRASEKLFLPVIEAATIGLKQATVKADGHVVTATGEMDLGPAVSKAVSGMLETMTARKKYINRSNNLKQIGIALQNFEATTGRLPTNVYGPKGELLLSWRVELLPYLEQDALYRQFRRDEPWDGPTNKKLIEKMPKVFQIPEREAPQGQTFFQAFISPDPTKPPPKDGKQFFGRSWLVEGDRNATRLAAIADGTSNTIGVVEARHSVVWSKPDDLPFGETIGPLGEMGAERFAVLFLDGSVRTISTVTKPEVLRILIGTQDGLLPPPLDDDDDFPRLFPFFLSSRKSSGADAAPTRNEPADRRELQEYERLRREAEVVRAEYTQAAAESARSAAEQKRVEELVKSRVATVKELDAATAAAQLAKQREAQALVVLEQLQQRLAAAEERLARQGLMPKTTTKEPRGFEKK